MTTARARSRRYHVGWIVQLGSLRERYDDARRNYVFSVLAARGHGRDEAPLGAVWNIGESS
jgi:hypothetical protein